MAESHARKVALTRFQGTRKSLHSLQQQIPLALSGNSPAVNQAIQHLLCIFGETADEYFEAASKLIEGSELDALQQGQYYEQVNSKIAEHLMLLSDVTRPYLTAKNGSYGEYEELRLIRQVIDAISYRFSPDGSDDRFLAIPALNFHYVHFNYAEQLGAIGVPPDVFSLPSWSFGILWHEVAGQQVAYLRRNGLLNQIAREFRSFMKEHESVAYSETIRSSVPDRSIDMADVERSWLGEFVEDMFGIVAIGPQMIEILADVLVQHYSDLDRGDESHPPPTLRLLVALELLDNMMEDNDDERMVQTRKDRLQYGYDASTSLADAVNQRIYDRYAISALKLRLAKDSSETPIIQRSMLSERIADYIYELDGNELTENYINNKVLCRGKNRAEEDIAKAYAAAVSDFYARPQLEAAGISEKFQTTLRSLLKADNNASVSTEATEISDETIPDDPLPGFPSCKEAQNVWALVDDVLLLFPDGASSDVRRKIRQLTPAIKTLLDEMHGRQPDMAEEPNGTSATKDGGEKEPQQSVEPQALDGSKEVAGKEGDDAWDAKNPVYRVRAIETPHSSESMIIAEQYTGLSSVRGVTSDYFVGSMRNEKSGYILGRRQTLEDDHIVRFSSIDTLKTVHVIVALDVEGRRLAVNDLEAMLQLTFAEIDGGYANQSGQNNSNTSKSTTIVQSDSTKAN